jgi:hypothetical protein
MHPRETSVAKFEETISGLAKAVGKFFKTWGHVSPENLCAHRE